MKSKTRYPVDRGLTGHMMFTAFLLGLLYAVVITALLVFAKADLALVLVIAAIVLFVQYYASDKIALYSMGGKLVTREQAPELYGAIDRLVALADMPMPRVALANTDVPNAFATGRNQKNAVVCVTTGLLRKLDPQELEAVLSHELSHVAHRDVAVMTIASFLGIVAGFMTRIFYFGELFGGMGGGRSRSRSNSQGNAALFMFAAMAFSMIVYAISFILVRSLSRYRELAADRSGAILIGQPALLASALKKVSGEMSRIPASDIRKSQHFNAFYFAPALLKGASPSSLFSTHPSLEKRLEQLAKLDAQMHKSLS